MIKKYKYSKERRDKISAGTKKAMANPEIRKKISLAKIGKTSPRKGVVLSKKLKKKMSIAHKGQTAWNKGLKGCYKQSKETIEKRVSKMRGSDNPAWKGGVVSENTKIRNSIEFRLWRETVYARDDWICQKCGERGGKLHAHHILNFSDYKELRFVIDNGITFCKKCHIKFHLKYSKTHNNKEQVKEFLLAVIKG